MAGNLAFHYFAFILYIQRSWTPKILLCTPRAPWTPSWEPLHYTFSKYRFLLTDNHKTKRQSQLILNNDMRVSHSSTVLRISDIVHRKKNKNLMSD